MVGWVSGAVYAYSTLLCSTLLYSSCDGWLWMVVGVVNEDGEGKGKAVS